MTRAVCVNCMQGITGVKMKDKSMGDIGARLRYGSTYREDYKARSLDFWDGADYQWKEAEKHMYGMAAVMLRKTE